MAHIIGAANDDILNGTPDDDLIDGFEGNDTLTGGGGNDILDGGTGADSMAGGPGDDIYYVDRGPYYWHWGISPGDSVIESASEGTDEVRLIGWSGYTLPANVENLTLFGSYNLWGTGNELANVLTGSEGDNWLEGRGDADTLIGGGGIDAVSYYQSPAGVTVSLSTSMGSGGDAQGDTLSGIENLYGSQFGDTLIGDGGGNQLVGGGGDDTLVGGEGNDLLSGESGNDTLLGGAGDDSFDGGLGNDDFDGGNGIDQAQYWFNPSLSGAMLAHGGQLVVGSVDAGLDRLAYIETVTFPDPISYTPVAVSATDADSPLEYIASCGDLMTTGLGADPAAGFDHFARTGYAEGRTVLFDGLEYIASYGDLIHAFGASVDAGATHYIGPGHVEGRQVTFNGLEYIASYGDLISTLGSDADAGASHFIVSGFSEGRATTFNGLEYIASYDDLIGRFSWDAQTRTASGVEDLGGSHYIRWGYAEQRAPDLFDASQYLANYIDLQTAFGTDTEAATLHYIAYGYYEGRTDYPGGVPPGQVIVGTDGGDYLSGGRGPDQISGLGGDDYIYGWLGDDAINGGPGNDYLSGDQGNDTLVGMGGDDWLYGGDGVDTASYDGPRSQYGVLKNYDEVVVKSVDDGLDHLWSSETETLSFADRSLPTARADTALEYIASYTDLMAAFGTDSWGGLSHFISYSFAEGRTVTFDGLEYIASYPDLINALHNDVAATADPDIGANHYIVAGYAEQRAPDLFDAAQYLANYADLQAAFGADTEAATLHYITAGYVEGRLDEPI